MIIKQAVVQSIIGIEANAMTGETVYVLDLHIQTKGINPDDFRHYNGKYDVLFEKATPILKERLI